MNPTIVDRDTFLQNLRISKLLTNQQFRVAVDKLGSVRDSREMAKALASWKLLTKFQARMLLVGRNSGFFIGPYRILDQLGQGGMGRVYKAVHQTMNRTVALKVLSPSLLNTERAHRLFQREVEAAAQLHHPNIVMAFDANESAGRHYLAMEYVDGPNLELYVRKNGPLPVGLACEVIFQAANGLAHAQERGMVHRDIKPANLLMQQEPGAEVIQVKILDFGLARFHKVEQDTSRSIETPHNTVMGTPDFVSPEQARSLHDVDIRADLYSLGCTFYYLLTGKVPFPGGNTVDKLIRHTSEIPELVEDLRKGIPKAVANIVRKLMEKDREDRYQTPDEVMDALVPFAAPGNLDWLKAANPPASERSDIELPVHEEAQGDTEPRARASTQISDHDSILEWVGSQSKERRKARQWWIVIALLLCGIITAGVAAVTAWFLIQQAAGS